MGRLHKENLPEPLDGLGKHLPPTELLRLGNQAIKLSRVQMS